MSQNIDKGFSYAGDDSFEGEKLIYPAASRNKEPILQVLKRFIINTKSNRSNEKPLLLEIASGSGQHLAHFAPNFPEVQFQPTEVDKNLLGSITYYANNCPTKNILQPKLIDISGELTECGFEENSIDYIYNANMIHISPYICTIGLFKNAGIVLKHGGYMFTYGPYSKDGIITPQSNIDFDKSLRTRDSSWGLRDINILVQLAKSNNLSLVENIDMPANNKILLWKKT